MDPIKHNNGELFKDALVRPKPRRKRRPCAEPLKLDPETIGSLIYSKNDTPPQYTAFVPVSRHRRRSISPIETPSTPPPLKFYKEKLPHEANEHSAEAADDISKPNTPSITPPGARTPIVARGFTPSNVPGLSSTPSPFLRRQSPVSQLTIALNFKERNESPELLHTQDSPSFEDPTQRTINTPPNTLNSLPEEAAALPIESPIENIVPDLPPSSPILNTPHNTPASLIDQITYQINELKVIDIFNLCKHSEN